jgi:hypothetical protein
LNREWDDGQEILDRTMLKMAPSSETFIHEDETEAKMKWTRRKNLVLSAGEEDLVRLLEYILKGEV